MDFCPNCVTQVNGNFICNSNAKYYILKKLGLNIFDVRRINMLLTERVKMGKKNTNKCYQKEI